MNMDEILKQFGGGEAMRAQAEQIWGMLDDMAQSDPKAYEAFLKRQYEEQEAAKKGKRNSFTPEPGFCIRSIATPLDAHRAARPVFINLCHSPVLQPPATDAGVPVVGKDGKENVELAMRLNDLSVPLTVGPVRQITVKGLNPAKPKKSATADVVDAIFNPWTINRCKTDRQFRANLINLALHWGGKENGLVVSPADVQSDGMQAYMGGTKGVGGEVLCEPYVITPEDREKAKEARDGKPPSSSSSSSATAGAAATAGPGAGTTDKGGDKPPEGMTMMSPADLLKTLKAGGGLGGGGDGGAGGGDGGGSGGIGAGIGARAAASPEVRLPGHVDPPAKKPLIEEVTATGKPKAKSSTPSLPVPTVSISTSADGASCVVQVELPGVTSMADCELDVAETSVSLKAPGFKKVVEALPGPVDHTSAGAKFKKRKHLLIITIPHKDA